LLLLAAACDLLPQDASPDAGTGPQAPTTAEQPAWLDTQNAVRRNAQQPVPNPPLPPLTWSAGAAAVAQAWADNCNYMHNSGRGDRGENIAASAPPGRWTLADAVAAWAGEAPDYDYATNTCAAGQQCGHYTQLVWRGTTRAGCAHRLCTTNSPFLPQAANWDYWVCDYEPPGNWVGQKPY
jgi:uncharacterized protein YkwD